MLIAAWIIASVVGPAFGLGCLLVAWNGSWEHEHGKRPPLPAMIFAVGMFWLPVVAWFASTIMGIVSITTGG